MDAKTHWQKTWSSASGGQVAYFALQPSIPRLTVKTSSFNWFTVNYLNMTTRWRRWPKWYDCISHLQLPGFLDTFSQVIRKSYWVTEMGCVTGQWWKKNSPEKWYKIVQMIDFTQTGNLKPTMKGLWPAGEEFHVLGDRFRDWLVVRGVTPMWEPLIPLSPLCPLKPLNALNWLCGDDEKLAQGRAGPAKLIGWVASTWVCVTGVVAAADCR